MPTAAPVASLPMYDWPEVRWATDALWSAVAERLRDAGIPAPDALDRSRDVEAVWRDPRLVLSQTCGFPYATRLIDSVSYVATPVYGVEGCEGPLYSSAIVARRDETEAALAEFAGRRVAFNARNSLSGHVALVAAMREGDLSPDMFDWIETGGHRASTSAVAAGDADLAAVDAVCWTLARRFDAEAVSGLHVVGQTPLRPALPFITSAKWSEGEVRTVGTALADALADPETKDVRAALLLTGVEVLAPAHYRPLASLISG